MYLNLVLISCFIFKKHQGSSDADANVNPWHPKELLTGCIYSHFFLSKSAIGGLELFTFVLLLFLLLNTMFDRCSKITSSVIRNWSCILKLFLIHLCVHKLSNRSWGVYIKHLACVSGDNFLPFITDSLLGTAQQRMTIKSRLVVKSLGSEPEGHQHVTNVPQGDGGEETRQCRLAGCSVKWLQRD